MENLLAMEDNVMVIFLLGNFLLILISVLIIVGITLDVVNKSMSSNDAIGGFVLVVFFILLVWINVYHNNFLYNIEGGNKLYTIGDEITINNWVEETTTEPYIHVIKKKGKYCYNELHSSEFFMRNIMGFKTIEKE